MFILEADFDPQVPLQFFGPYESQEAARADVRLVMHCELEEADRPSFDIVDAADPLPDGCTLQPPISIAWGAEHAE